MAEPASPKLDIFRVLNAVNTCDKDFFVNLSDEERKAFQPFLVSRWMSGSSDALQTFLINEYVNPYAFSLQGHKELIWDLMVVCSSGRSHRYVWNKLPSGASTNKPTCVRVISQFYNYSTSDATQALQCLTYDDVMDMADCLGLQQDDLVKIKKEFK